MALLSFVLLILVSILSCDSKVKEKGFDRTPIAYFESCTSYEFTIDSLPYEQLSNMGYSLKDINDTAFLRDPQDVILYENNGSFYYHAVLMCHKAFSILAAYHNTRDRRYLDRAETYAKRLMKEAMEFDGAAYFPYQFDYNVNQQDSGLLSAPWFSGMAQGEGLGVFVRMFLETGDSAYLNFAHKVFGSFLRLKGEATPWTVFVDPRGCYWIEEYPLPEPSMTLNGFIYGLYGVYDYYQLTKSEKAKQVLTASLSTIKNYIPLYRRPGRPSFYGLRFQHFAANYHMVHIGQLRHLAKITHDPFFESWADTLYSDYHR